MNKKKEFGIRLNEIINQKLEIACHICGISVDDTKTGKKHINKHEVDDMITYIYAEEKLTILVVIFTGKKMYIKRIRRYQWWIHRIKSVLKWVSK